MENSVIHEDLSSSHFEKVSFHLPKDGWHGIESETLWAMRKEDTFILKNVPFYVAGVSYDDVVFAVREGSTNWFTRVAERGGHSTYRIMLAPGIKLQRFEECWKPIEGLGCSYERCGSKLIAVDVPASANVFDVYRYLEVGEEEEVWDFEEGHCGHPVG